MTATTYRVIHRQVHIAHGEREADVDTGIQRLILALWEAGHDTGSSCQDMSWMGAPMAYVFFPRERDAHWFRDLSDGTIFTISDEERAEAIAEGLPDSWGSSAGTGVLFPPHLITTLTRRVRGSVAT